MGAGVQLPTFLVGHLLVAMPQMSDPRFERSVIFLCAHSADGAMGLVVNKLFDRLTFNDLLEQLNIETRAEAKQIRIHFGGPVESGRGFVLHSDDYVRDSTLVVPSGFALTATIDILKAIAAGAGPRHSLLALGYAGWGSGQLESEIGANGWLAVPADAKLVFDPELDRKWQSALAKVGVNLTTLSGQSGRA
ncbi:MAG: YqgE/AlgH family protein [Pseudomonadota bacterium]